MDKELFTEIAETMRELFPNASDDLLLEKTYQAYEAKMMRHDEAKDTDRKGVVDGSSKPNLFKDTTIGKLLFNDDDW